MNHDFLMTGIAGVLFLAQAATGLLVKRVLSELDTMKRDIRSIREAWAAKFGEPLDGGASG